MAQHEDIFVICKKCEHGARLYHNPNGGCIKNGQSDVAIPTYGTRYSHPSNEWVDTVCENKRCKNYNKPEYLSKDDFESLRFHPNCTVCGKEMKKIRELQGKGNYAFECPNENCHSHCLLADYLPVWDESQL